MSSPALEGRNEAMKREDKVNEFFEHNEIDCMSIDTDPETGEDHDPYFTWSGCDICNNRLGSNVYPCSGYSPKHDKVFDGFEVCHQCLCYIYNGDGGNEKVEE